MSRLHLIGLALGLLFAVPATTAEPGAVADSQAEREMVENEAWNAFCDRLKETGREILREDLPATDLDRAEGQRYLLQRLSASIDEVLDGESGPPVVELYSHKLGKYGMDSADAKYSTARLAGGGTYRLSGRLGTAHHIAFQLVTNRNGYEAFDSISREDIPVDGSGSFELRISANRPEDWEGAWLRLHPRASEILLREYFYDWANEGPSEFRIERLDRIGPSIPITPAATDALFDEIGDLFAATVPKWFGPSQYDRTQRVNTLGAPAKSGSEGLRENAYGSGWFRLGADEVLLIELDEPTAHLWSFELGTFWWQSIDYVDHGSSLNGFQAVKSSDGRYRLVIALEDPGVPNWLDPAGHSEGVIIYRYQKAPDVNPIPVARVVARSKLREALPADTPKVSAEARKAEIRMRQQNAARRWAP